MLAVGHIRPVLKGGARRRIRQNVKNGVSPARKTNVCPRDNLPRPSESHWPSIKHRYLDKETEAQRGEGTW